MLANWKALVDLADEIKRCDEHNLNRASIALSYVCIDALANLSRPIEKSKATRQDFIHWVNNYLIGHPEQPYQYSGKDVYAARCALLHNLGSEAEVHDEQLDIKIFGYHDGGKHCFNSELDSRLVVIGIKSFTNDVRSGILKFMDACSADLNLRTLVESRLDKVLSNMPL